MDIFKSAVNGSMTMPLVLLIALMALSTLVSTQLKESSLMSKEKTRKAA
jgi:hypothetical protein